MNNDKNKYDREKITFIQGFNDNDSKTLSENYPNAIVFSKPKKYKDIYIKNIYKNGFSYNKIQGINSNNIILDDNKISLGIDDHDLLNINKNLIIPRYFYTGAYNPFFKKYLTLNTEKLNHYNINNIENFNNIDDDFLCEETNEQNKLNENNYLIIESIDNYNKIIISKIDESQLSLISYKKIDDDKFIKQNLSDEKIIILLDKYERLYISKVENVNIKSSGKFNVFGNLNNKNNNDQYYFESQNLSGLFKDSKVVDASSLILHNTLTEGCYKSMFKGCTELEKAPELPATTLVNNCYKEIFYGCSKLNYIKTQFKQRKNNENNFEDLDGTNLPLYTLNWVKNVAEIGTFINIFIKSNDWNIYDENNNIKDGILGVNGIPKLWVDDEERPYDINFGGPYIKQYLTIENVSDDIASIILPIGVSYRKSKDITWTKIESSSEPSDSIIELNNEDNKVYLKGNFNSNSYENGKLYQSNSFGKFIVYGNIMSLCNGDGFKDSYNEISSNNCFKNFFSNLNIIDAANLILPATTITDSCYAYMFAGCKELITSPELPATTLKESCYESMFKDCENLKNAPKLIATSLANNCYKSMFEGCKNLKNTPELIATSLVNNCYESMFKDCTSLINAPILPATNLSYEENGEIKTADNCYTHMFEGCTSLTIAPDLPATILVNGCYMHMFEGCTSLTSAPYLTINELSTNCFNSMFNGCTSLDYIKYNGSYKNDNNQFTNWLNGVAESGTFVNIKDDNNIITGSVDGIPEGWTKYDSSSKRLIIDPLELGQLFINKGTYVNNQKINYLKNNKNIQYESDNNHLEINLTKRDIIIIKSITEDLNTQLNNIINDENSLVHISSNIKFNLFGDLSSYDLIKLNNSNYNLLLYLFINSLVFDASKLCLKEGTLNVDTDKYCYYKMFKGCTLLTNAPKLPATTLTEGCYQSMFEGCTLLEKAPELPAITLVNNCYQSMFENCSKLNYIKALFEDIKENNNYPYTKNWVKNVAVNGQFIKSDNWNISENNIIKDGILGVNGIPELWVDEQNNNYFIEYKNRYLTIERTSEDIVKLQWPKTATTNNHKTISYSFNNINWNEISSENLNIIELNNEHNKVYLKGNNTSYSNMTLHNIIENNSNISFKVYGNIMSLFYGDDFKDKTTFPNNSSYNLTNFFKTTNVDDASNLILPVTTLTKCCYQYMFNNCNKLINIPELPATTLADNCYLGMFMDCTNIINVSKKLLPATTLSKQCYWYMFKGCKSLENAPELPAETLAQSCYKSMFENCTSLETGPQLPATTLAESCYQAMFKGCESLTSIIGELPGEKMEKSCYESMFEGCKSLENAPIIYATQITNRSFAYMFNDCCNLRTIVYAGRWANATSSYDPNTDPTYPYATSHWNTVEQAPFYHWVDNVYETGQFINPNSLPFEDYVLGYDGTIILYYIIPSDWEKINNQLYTNNTRAARLSSLTVDFDNTDNNDNNNLNTFSLLRNNIENYHKYTIVDENNYPAQAFIIMPDKWENELLIFKDNDKENINIFNKNLFKPLKQNIILDDECKYNVYVTQFTCNTITFKKSS